MILTCPACLTRYLVDPRSLGVAGRAVRCAHCGATWHQIPPADAPRRVDVVPPPDPDMPVVRTNLPALRPPPRRPPNYLPWTLAVAAMVGAVVIGHLARERIVEAWPPAAKVYAMLGLRVEPLGAGLEIRGIVTERRMAGAEPELMVTGEIANASSEERTVPRLRAVLKDAGERAISSWTFPASGTRLLPGETTTFTTTVRDPDRRAAGLSITFTKGS
ncbi:MAG: zinc-ribbon domain-containing protein [Alphaproteobacteria bacterium]|nr:zinc-ribbon domain-containing protein [Alphaproteobacteria bacterium]